MSQVDTLLDLMDSVSAPRNTEGGTTCGEGAPADESSREMLPSQQIRAFLRETFPHLAPSSATVRLAKPCPICRHIKPSGERCGSPRLRGNHLYCYFHSRLHDGGATRPPSPSQENLLDLPPLEDRSAVTLALGQITRALIADKISERKAGVLLYALQLAMQASPLPKTPSKPTLETNVAEDDELGDYAPLTEEENAEIAQLRRKLIAERTATAAGQSPPHNPISNVRESTRDAI
jgi:hypothetical protein